MKSSEIPKGLARLPREPGREDRQLAILGEGNVSADLIAHGPVVLEQRGNEVLPAMLMLDKRAKILPGNYAVGAPQFPDEEHSDRIEDQPDEHYGRQAINRLK